MIPAEKLALLDAAYDRLDSTLEDMLEREGFDPRAVLGAMGRHLIQLLHDECDAAELRIFVQGFCAGLGVEP